MIAEAIARVAGATQPEKSAYWPRMSSAGPERCIRQMVYHAGDFPYRPLDDRALLVFNDSEWHEELTGDWLRKTAYRLHSEQMGVTLALPFKARRYCQSCKEHIDGLHGHWDGLLTDLVERDWAYEHKAINHFTWEALWEGDGLPLDNLSQLACYMRGGRKYADLTRGVLTLKNKNTSGIMDYDVRYHEDTMWVLSKTNHLGETREVGWMLPGVTEFAVRKFARVEKLRKAKTLPARPYTKDTWRCGYCPYGETCWENYEDEHDKRAENVELPGLNDVVYAYKFAQREESKWKGWKEWARDEIKQTMEEANAKHAVCGNWETETKIQTGEKINKDKIPPAILEKATEETFSERLYMKKRKDQDNVTRGKRSRKTKPAA
jgi:hypothetical protein